MNTYRESSKLLAPLLGKKNGPGLKALAFGGKNKAPTKAVFACVSHTLRCRSVIDSVLGRVKGETQVDVLKDIRDRALGYVLLYELLLGPYKSIRGGGGVKRSIMKHEKILREALSYLAAHGDAATKNHIETSTEDTSNSSGVQTSHWPKYVRVNTLKVSLETAVTSAQSFLGSDNVSLHTALDNIMAIPPTVNNLYEWDLVKSGSVVIQDLSSCLTAAALAGGEGSTHWWDTPKMNVFLDACAAPGNKTTHLAALVNQNLSSSKSSNKVVALDRSGDRIKILQKRVSLLAPGGVVEPLHLDFLKTESNDSNFSKLKAILLDPSCSGSGIVNSPDRGGEEDTPERLKSLSNFQLLALLHALSFPQVEYVAYSTCSMNNEENEAVVSKALQEVNEGLEGGEVWELRRPKVLDTWTRRGKAVEGLTEEQANCLCRCNPFEGDETNGFFVSYFVRAKVDRNEEKYANSVASNSSALKVPMYKAGMFKHLMKGKGEGGKKKKSRESSDQSFDNGGTKRKAEESISEPHKSPKKEQKKTKWTETSETSDISDSKSSVPKPPATKMSKKAAKKNAYKTKQREQKLARLKKKKAEAGGAKN